MDCQNVTLKKHFLFEGELGSETKYSYDNTGRIIEELTFNPDGEPKEKKTYQYNFNDLLESETYWDGITGEPKLIFEYEYEKYKLY